MPAPRKILLVRNDKLGDFMLAWPSFALLRHALPQAKLHALVPHYTRPLAEICPYLDTVLTDPGRESGWKGLKQLVAALREQHYDAVISLFSTGRAGFAVAAARIPYRLAPATKIAQLFYTQRELQRRSRSEKPEWQYNCDLIYRFLRDHSISTPADPVPPYLTFDQDSIVAARVHFHEQYGINKTSRLVFLHPGSGGSANNLNIAQYAELAQLLNSDIPLTFVISAGPGEGPLAEELAALLGQRNLTACTYHSNAGLVDFAQHLSLAHLFISGSTGPLHIAGALNLRTVGFYPRKRSSTTLRWQTLSEETRRLAFSPPADAGESDMLSVDIAAAAAMISDRFLWGSADDAG